MTTTAAENSPSESVAHGFTVFSTFELTGSHHLQQVLLNGIRNIVCRDWWNVRKQRRCKRRTHYSPMNHYISSGPMKCQSFRRTFSMQRMSRSTEQLLRMQCPSIAQGYHFHGFIIMPHTLKAFNEIQCVIVVASTTPSYAQ